MYPKGGLLLERGQRRHVGDHVLRLRPDPVPAPRRIRELRDADLDQPGLTMLEEALRRDRIVTAAGLVVLAALAWAYVVRMAAAPVRRMSSHDDAERWRDGRSTPALAWLVGMWIVMMVAMMLPSAAPTILLFATVAAAAARPGNTGRAGRRCSRSDTCWSGRSTPRSRQARSGSFTAARCSRPSMASASPALAGGLLVAAGLYQWLPIKGVVSVALPLAARVLLVGVARRDVAARSSWACGTAASASAAAGCSWRCCSSRA